MSNKIFDKVMEDAINTFAHTGSNSLKTIETVSAIAKAIGDPWLLMWAQARAQELQQKERDNKIKGISAEVSDLSWNYSKDDFPLHGGLKNALKGAVESVTETVKEKFINSAKAFYGKLTESWVDTHIYDIDNIGSFAKDPQNQHVARELDTASQSVIQEINTVVGNSVQATQERVKAVKEVNSPAQQVLGMVDKDNKIEEAQVREKAEEETLHSRLRENTKPVGGENFSPEINTEELGANILDKLRAEKISLARNSTNVQMPFTPITQEAIGQKAGSYFINPLIKRK